MKNSRKLLTTALAATMLIGAVAASTPASAWSTWGWGGGWPRPWNYGASSGWGYGRWGYPSGYSYWGSAYPGYYGYGAAYPRYYGYRRGHCAW